MSPPPNDLRVLQHELRTPLNAVLGLSQLIKATQHAQLPEHVRRWIDQIEDAGQHMLQLVESLGASPERRLAGDASGASSDLLRAVQGAIRMMRLPAVEAGVQVTLLAQVERPIAVCGSETAHRQVLINLLSNAVKYSPRGTQVRIEVAGPVLGDAWARVVVRDQGIGMDGAQLARLGRPYERLGREGDSAGGSGLGLYLSRQLVASAGGALDIDSRPGVGTAVTVRLPTPCLEPA